MTAGKVAVQLLEKPVEMALAKWGMKEVLSVSLLTTAVVEYGPKLLGSVWRFFFPPKQPVTLDQGKQIMGRLDKVEGNLGTLNTTVNKGFDDVRVRLEALEKKHATGQPAPVSTVRASGNLKV